MKIKSMVLALLTSLVFTSSPAQADEFRGPSCKPGLLFKDAEMIRVGTHAAGYKIGDVVQFKTDDDASRIVLTHKGHYNKPKQQTDCVLEAGSEILGYKANGKMIPVWIISVPTNMDRQTLAVERSADADERTAKATERSADALENIADKAMFGGCTAMCVLTQTLKDVTQVAPQSVVPAQTPAPAPTSSSSKKKVYSAHYRACAVIVRNGGSWKGGEFRLSNGHIDRRCNNAASTSFSKKAYSGKKAAQASSYQKVARKGATVSVSFTTRWCKDGRKVRSTSAYLRDPNSGQHLGSVPHQGKHKMNLCKGVRPVTDTGGSGSGGAQKGTDRTNPSVNSGRSNPTTSSDRSNPGVKS